MVVGFGLPLVFCVFCYGGWGWASLVFLECCVVWVLACVYTCCCSGAGLGDLGEEEVGGDQGDHEETDQVEEEAVKVEEETVQVEEAPQKEGMKPGTKGEEDEGEGEGENIIGVIGQVKAAGDGTQWKAMWVKVNPKGIPEQPLVIKPELKKARITYAPPTTKACAPKPPTTMAEPSEAMGGGSIQELISGLTGALKEIAKGSNPQDKGELEEGGPKIRFTPEAKAWKLSQRDEEAGRMAWPLEPNFDVDLKKFKVYLEAHCGQAKKSMQQNIRLVWYVYGMFQLPSKFSQEGFWAEMYLSGKGETWASLDILSPLIPNTANISTAVDHLIDHLIMQAGRKRHTEASRCLNGFKNEVLAPLRTKVQVQKNAARLLRLEKDAARLEQLPPQEVLKDAIKDTMICLHWASVRAQEGQAQAQDQDRNLKACTNALMAGIVFCNTYAGRPGEWAVLERSEVEEMMQAGQDWIKLTKHKTKKVYGSCGRAVPEGTRMCMQAALKVHPAEAKFFFDPARASTKVVTMSSLLTKWSEVFTPDHLSAGPTLQRKLMHTKPQDEEVASKVFAEICKYDKHKTTTGQRNYVAAALEDEAKKGAIIFKNVLGDPVQWPTPQEVKAGKAKALKTLDLMYKRTSSKADQGEDDEGGVEEAFEDPEDGEEEGEEEEEEHAAEDDALEGAAEALAREEEGKAGEPERPAAEVDGGGWKQWVLKKYMDLLAKKGLPEGHITVKPAFYQTLRLAAKQAGLIGDEVTPDMVHGYIVFEMHKAKVKDEATGKPTAMPAEGQGGEAKAAEGQGGEAREGAGAAPTEEGPSIKEEGGSEGAKAAGGHKRREGEVVKIFEGRKRRKISQALDSWIVNSYVMAYDADPTQNLGTGWFKKLQERAIEEKLMAKDSLLLYHIIVTMQSHTPHFWMHALLVL